MTCNFNGLNVLNDRLYEKPVHDSTRLTTNGPALLDIEYLSVRPETLRDERKSSIGSFDPRGDCAPGNDSTTASTRRKDLLKVRPLRQRSRGVVPERAHRKSV